MESERQFYINTDLQYAIYTITGILPQSKYDMESFTGVLDLSSVNTGIILKNLEGINYAINIEQLNISNNEIEDDAFDLLKELNNLIWLEAENNKITNISSISSLNYLKGLILSNNKINDIGALSSLKQLEILRLNNCFDNLPGERLLKLKELTNLYTLDIGNNGIDIISSNNEPLIPNISKLITLGLSNNNIENIEILSLAENLNVLSLNKNNISNGTALKELIKLRVLDISNNKISNISLDKLKELERLNLSNNKITNIESIRFLSNIEELDLSGNDIGNLNIIPNFNQYGLLYLNNCNLNSESLKMLSVNNLYYLSLDDNSIDDISPLIKFKNLEILKLNNNKIENISGLNEISNLFVIYLDNNYIKDISPLGSITSLENGISVKNQNIIIDPGNIDGSYLLDLNNRLIDINGSVPSNVMNILPTGKAEYNYGSSIVWNDIDSDDSLIFDFLNGTLENYTWNGTVILTREVNIPDKNLKRELINILGLESNERVTEDNLSRIEILDLSDKEIYDIEGLQYLVNLKKLTLNKNSIRDISVIGNLVNLQELNLSQSGNVNVDNLIALGNLQVLDISNNNITNINGLEKMAYLKGLDISNNNIASLEPLKNKENLIDFNGNNNKLIDITGILDLENLVGIELINQRVDYPIQSTDYNGKVKISLSLLTLEGKGSIEIIDISHGGNREEDSIIWNKISTSTTVYFDYKVKFQQAVSGQRSYYNTRESQVYTVIGKASIKVLKPVTRGIKLF